MNKIQNHDDVDNASSSSTKRFNTFDNINGVAPWSNLNHDVLFLVMMQLGVVDFLSFSRVCKSWRSFAVSNKNIFMASRPPMLISISRDRENNKNYCHMRDFKGRTLEIILPDSLYLTCIGISCGYMIFFVNSRHDFYLVNPITQHQLHFPSRSLYGNAYSHPDMAILVFSRSISSLVLVISKNRSKIISCYIEGKRGWTNHYSTLPILDLHAFKGKIHTLHTDCCLGEMRVIPKPKFTLFGTNNLSKPDSGRTEFLSSGENLYIMNHYNLVQKLNTNKIRELDFGEMKWVSPEKTIGKYAFFLSKYTYSAAIKPESWSWADPLPLTQCKIYDFFRRENLRKPNNTRPSMFFYGDMWYFPHDCLKVNLVDE